MHILRICRIDNTMLEEIKFVVGNISSVVFSTM